MCLMHAIHVHGRDIEQVKKKVQFAVLPLGSIEYHGPHSPLSTDIILANGFAERIEETLEPLLYPVIPYTACPGKTRHYPGTISIRPSVFIDYMMDVVEGICELGIRNIVLLNAHDANMGPSRTVAEAVTGKYADARFLLINWWQMVSLESAERKGIFHGTAGRGHGGPYEMSAVKAFRPDLVHVKESDLSLYASQPLSSLPYVLVEGSPDGWDGYTGDIQQTSLEAGQWIVEEAANNMNELLKNWLGTIKGNGEGEQRGIS